jgi:hypothetical protein
MTKTLAVWSGPTVLTMSEHMVRKFYREES